LCVDAGDLDGDGDLDVVHAGQGNDSFSVTDTFSVGWHENLGGGEIDTTVNAVFNNDNSYILSLVVVDIDVDGDLDLLFDKAENGYMGYHPNTRITSASVKLETPDAFSLSQNYPNPFNPATTIRYALPKAAMVRLTVYNALGQVVRELESSFKQAGYHEATFNASDLGSGVYFYRIDAVGSSGERFQETRKMLLIK
ncbi:MAG: T9SS type A sorting domain-containing protein, partial [Ignavibacteriales bacterium]|nr:T9SS type A sorting domain-containing protein [Ignavibacteriales bacterium]